MTMIKVWGKSFVYYDVCPIQAKVYRIPNTSCTLWQKQWQSWQKYTLFLLFTFNF